MLGALKGFIGKRSRPEVIKELKTHFLRKQRLIVEKVENGLMVIVSVDDANKRFWSTEKMAYAEWITGSYEPVEIESNEQLRFYIGDLWEKDAYVLAHAYADAFKNEDYDGRGYYNVVHESFTQVDVGASGYYGDYDLLEGVKTLARTFLAFKDGYDFERHRVRFHDENGCWPEEFGRYYHDLNHRTEKRYDQYMNELRNSVDEDVTREKVLDHIRNRGFDAICGRYNDKMTYVPLLKDTVRNAITGEIIY